MKLVNLTPHEVVFFRQSDCVKTPRGFVLTANADPVLRVPSTGLARADAAERELGYVECNGVVLPCVRNDYGDVIGLPEKPEPDTLYIISSLTAQAVKKNESVSRVWQDHLRLVARTVRDSKGIMPCVAGSSEAGGTYRAGQQGHHHRVLWPCGSLLM